MARIANLAMMEFAIIRAFPFPHSTAALALREKMKPQPRFKAFASILPEHFIADFARGRICSKRLGRAKTVPNPASFLGVGAKSLRIQIRKPNPSQSLYSFPLFPAVSRFRTHISNINGAMYRAKIAPLPYV